MELLKNPTAVQLNIRHLTLRELARELNAAVRAGYGKCIVVAANDEECNGIHQVFGKTEFQGEDGRKHVVKLTGHAEIGEFDECQLDFGLRNIATANPHEGIFLLR